MTSFRVPAWSRQLAQVEVCIWMDQCHSGSLAGPCRFAVEAAAGLVNITRKAINKWGRDDFSLDLFKSSH